MITWINSSLGLEYMDLRKIESVCIAGNTGDDGLSSLAESLGEGVSVASLFRSASAATNGTALTSTFCTEKNIYEIIITRRRLNFNTYLR